MKNSDRNTTADTSSSNRSFRILKIVSLLLLSLLVAAVIMEGTYQLLGNGLLGRLVCTAALIAVAPFVIMLLMRIVSGTERSAEDTDKHDPQEK